MTGSVSFRGWNFQHGSNYTDVIGIHKPALDVYARLFSRLSRNLLSCNEQELPQKFFGLVDCREPDGCFAVLAVRRTNMEDRRRRPEAERATTHITFNGTQAFRDLLDMASQAAGYSNRTEWMKQVLTKAARLALKSPVN